MVLGVLVTATATIGLFAQADHTRASRIPMILASLGFILVLSGALHRRMLLRRPLRFLAAAFIAVFMVVTVLLLFLELRSLL
jgi:hypothetical protein